MALNLAACSGDEPVETQATENNAAQATPQTDPAEEEPNALSFSFTQYGNTRITLVGAEFIKDDWDEDALRIYYDYTTIYHDK
jgi:hypothetical protein